MKILHISTTDVIGGAGIAAKRLHDALRVQGVESFMLVQRKKSNDEYVIKSSKIPFINKLRSELELLPIKRKLKNKHNFSVAWLPENINYSIKKIKPDIIHLHWINGGFIRIESLSNIKIPIIWSLHDMWPFTGGCHYANGCDQFMNECRNCPELINNSISKKILKRKHDSFKEIKHLHINGLSKWLAHSASESKLFRERTIHNLPNCINTDVFYPIEKEKAKNALGIRSDKKLVLFGGIAATIDNRKGFDLLTVALSNIREKQNLILGIFGVSKGYRQFMEGFEKKFLGHISDINQLRLAYSAADVAVVPSRQENLSNVVLEALSCGTPVVAFNIGGMPDMINHKVNGYLAKPFQTADLADGIEWAIMDSQAKILQKNSRATILKTYESKIVAEKYIKLYLQLSGS